MKHGFVIALALTALPGQARADGFSDRACKSLRHALRVNDPVHGAAPIAVTEHHPVLVAGKLADRPLFYRCNPLPGGEHMKPIDAEATR